MTAWLYITPYLVTEIKLIGTLSLPWHNNASQAYNNHNCLNELQTTGKPETILHIL